MNFRQSEIERNGKMMRTKKKQQQGKETEVSKCYSIMGYCRELNVLGERECDVSRNTLK